MATATIARNRSGAGRPSGDETQDVVRDEDIAPYAAHSKARAIELFSSCHATFDLTLITTLASSASP